MSDEADVSRLEGMIRELRAEVRREMLALRSEISKANNFQIGFQAISKGLTYVCIIAAALATIYAAVGRHK